MSPPSLIPVFDPSAPPPSSDEASCPFCAIAHTYAPYSPLDPPSAATSHTVTSHLSPSPPPSSSSSSSSDPNTTTTTTSPLDPFRLSPSCYVLLSTPTVLAFLDILPLAQGHLLLCPRAHRPKLTDVTDAESAELGRWLRLLSRALCAATGVRDWNVVQNNGAAAAQVVGHVHYHLIPRPELRAPPVTTTRGRIPGGKEEEEGRIKMRQSFTMFGKGRREELDDDEAAEFAEKMRGCVKKVLEEETSKGKL